MTVLAGVIDRWHHHTKGELVGGVESLLHDDVVFYSPVLFKPVNGKANVAMYLNSAVEVFFVHGPDGERAFRYTQQMLAGETAVLEFETTLGGKYVNGVDIVKIDAQGLIVEFKVMIRPLQAVQTVSEHMTPVLQARAAAQP